MIVFLSGSKDSGKTTTAQILQGMDRRIAVVEPDTFFPFLPDTFSILEKAPFCVEASAWCARRLHAMGFIVLVVYPLTDTDYARYEALLADVLDGPPLCITLVPERERLLIRLGLEQDDTDEGRFRRRVIESQYERDDRGFNVVYVTHPTVTVDSTELTPEETAARVHALIDIARRNEYATIRKNRGATGAPRQADQRSA